MPPPAWKAAAGACPTRCCVRWPDTRCAASSAPTRRRAPWLGAALTLAVALGGATAGVRTVGAPLILCGAYLLQAMIWWLTDQLRMFRALQSARWQWWMTIGVDLVVFGAIHWIDPTASLNFAALLVLPVLMAGILTPRLPARATAAGVALMLLAAAGRAAGSAIDPAALMSQAGLSGIGLFFVALLAGELSMRLAHEERTARDSRERARQQAPLARLVIEDMQDGVLVVDRQLRVRAANPVGAPAAGGAGVALPARRRSPLRLHPGWLVLADEVEQAFGRGTWPAAPFDLNILLEDGTRRALHIRGRFDAQPLRRQRHRARRRAAVRAVRRGSAHRAGAAAL